MGSHLYLKIKEKLWSAIADGNYPPGSALPPIAELATTFGASTKTVQKAIHALSDDGVIEAQRGKGIFVRSLKILARKSRRVGLVYPANRNYIKGRPYPANVIDPFRSTLRRAGYSVVPCPLTEIEPMGEIAYMRGLGLAAVALFEMDSDRLAMELKDLCLPMVAMDADAYRLGISSSVFDNSLSGFQATKALLDLGHREIAFLRPFYSHQIGNNP